MDRPGSHDIPRARVLAPLREMKLHVEEMGPLTRHDFLLGGKTRVGRRARFDDHAASSGEAQRLHRADCRRSTRGGRSAASSEGRSGHFQEANRGRARPGTMVIVPGKDRFRSSPEINDKQIETRSPSRTSLP